MKAAADRFTVQDYAALPEGFPAQLVEGCLVKEVPLYGHQALVRTLLSRLEDVIDGRRVLPGPVGVHIDEYNVFHPDVAVFDGLPPPRDRRTLTPAVVFEVLSPSTRRRDKGVKCRRYLQAGVREVWLVDADEGVVEVHSQGGIRAGRGAEATASEVLSGFALVPRDLFAEWRECP